MMNRRIAHALAALVLIAAPLLSLAPPARADVIPILVSEDTAPYSFLPSLIRFNNPSVWALRGEDEEGGSQHQLETFLWFDVDLSDIPAGHVLVDAEVLVTWDIENTGFGDPSTDPADLNCHRITEDWNQTTLNWINKPDFDPAFDSITNITTLGSVLCDAWPVVFDWIYNGAPNYGVAITNDQGRGFGMHSLEADPSIPDSLKANLILTTEVPEPGLGTGLAFGTLALSAVRRRRR
ncbi:MAG: DNRLRE domain-containing protein [bacterium]|nr:DNRLRE domain-containing protein [bacterium]